MAFTLNLSAGRERMLMCRPDPADDLRRYIAREMRAAVGSALPFSFAFEIAPGGKLHIHGVLLPLNDAPDHRKAIRQALARAGGAIKGKEAGRQVDLKPLTDGLGWAVYSQKDFDTACRHLGTNKITFVSQELKRLAKAHHDELAKSRLQ